jgi:hypothetical protein
MSPKGILIAAVTISAEGTSADPVWLPAELIDSAMEDGTLEPGALNNVTILLPPIGCWPARWRSLRS